MNNILIVDFDVFDHGHNVGYLKSIIFYLKNKPNNNNHTILLNTHAKKYFSDIERTSLLSIIFPTDVENAFIVLDKGDFRRRECELKIIYSYSRTLNSHEILFLHIDQYLPSFILKRPKIIISGIYFRPSTRVYYNGNNCFEYLNYHIRKLKKRVLEYLFFRNTSIGHLFLLNDQCSVSQLNNMYGNITYYLPDPIFEYNLLPYYNIRERYDIEFNSTIFLIFGAISERKNLENIISAFTLLENKKNVVLLIVGTLTNKYKLKFDQILSMVSKSIDLRVIFDNRFVSDNEMESIFSQSDLILIPYKDLFTSSGIIGTAAKYNKKCIVSNVGVLAELCDEYDLGFKANPYEPKSIRDAIEVFLLGTYDRGDSSLSKQFTEKHKPEIFAQTLLET